jgi:Flp pilus assembly protein TadB
VWVTVVAERRPALRRRSLALAAVLGAALAVPGSGASATVTSAARTATATKIVLGATGQLGAVARQAGSASQTTSTSASAKTKAKHRTPPPVPLSGWLADGVAFPQRAVVLNAPSGGPLTAATLHVTENGAPVTGATLTPLAQAGKGDLGVMLAVDQSTAMAGAPLAAAMTAVRGFAVQRTPQEQVGLITFDQTPNVILHPSSDTTTIFRSLVATPWTGPQANVPAATQLALSELAHAKLAVGAIVVIADGAQTLVTPNGTTPASVTAAALAARVPVFTVGLQDARSSATALNGLKASSPSPGQFVATTAAQLPSVLAQIQTALTRGYVLRYRSAQPAGQAVNLTVSATSAPGSVQVSYQAPKAPPKRPAVAPSPKPVKRQTGPDFSHTTLLTPQPAFAASAPPPASSAQTSFWNSSGSIPIVAGIAGLLFVFSAWLVLRRPSKRAVLVRVKNFIPGEDGSEPGDSIQIASRGGKPRLFERARWWAPFVQDVAISRSSFAPTALVKRAAIGGAVVSVLAFLVSGSLLIAVLPLLLWPFPLRWFVKRGARKQRELFADSLPGYLQDLSSAMRVGRSFASALGIVAASADEPVRSELERAVTDEALGRPLEESLEAVATRMQANDMDQVALIASLGRRSGSNVSEALERVADGARDRADLRREIKALTAQAKMSNIVLTGLPPLLLLAISLVSPQYAHPLLHTTIGIVLLVVAALMVFAGWKVMKKITTIKA